jgi:hypothetical protein
VPGGLGFTPGSPVSRATVALVEVGPMFKRERKAQQDLEAALADLVKSGVTLAETLCGAFHRATPITPGEIDAIERMIVRTLVDDAQRAMVASGTPATAVRVVMPGLEAEFRASFSPRFRALAPLMTPTGSAQ